MRKRFNIIKVLSGLFLKLAVLLSLAVVPLSMSHASMMSFDGTKTQENHSMMGHGKDHSMHKTDLGLANTDIEVFDGSNHQNHDNSDCCSSICGGALTVEFYNTPCIPKRSANKIADAAAVAPGEWVTPHRPPSI